MSAPVKAVLFDAVGTLIKPCPAVAEAYLAVGLRHGTTLTLTDVRTNFAEAVRQYAAEDERNHNYRTDETREQNRWRTIIRLVFTDLTHDAAALDGLFDDLWEHFADARHWVLFDDVASTWQQLQEKGLTLGVASNFDRRLLAIGQAMAPIADCKHWFVSSIMGHRKPGCAFFTTIEEQLGLSGEELVLVGDDIMNDYRAARAAGWQAFLIDRSGSSNGSNGDSAAHTLRGLDELLDVLAL